MESHLADNPALDFRTLAVRGEILPRSQQAKPWLSVVSHLDPKYGGLSSAVPALASAVAGTGTCEMRVAGFCQASEQYRPEVQHAVSFRYYPPSRKAWYTDRSLRQKFEREVAAAEGVHIHGLWQASTSVAASAARSRKIPYLVSAHGMLESWALANKGFKKRLYAALFERSTLNAARCLHALTDAEANDFRQFGLKNPIAVIPNGVDIPDTLSPEAFLTRFPHLRGRVLVLFLGRIHFKKGLDILADAWAEIGVRFPEAHLVLAGPDFEGTQAHIEKRFATSGLTDRVTFTGMLTGEMKWSALAAAHGFILPSYSEGLSVSVLEAMGVGLPVIVTRQCNVPEVEQHACGWTIEPRAPDVRNALENLLQASAASLQKMGQNGKRLVAERYAWPVIGRQMASLYQWMAGGPLPVELDLRPGKSS